MILFSLSTRHPPLPVLFFFDLCLDSTPDWKYFKEQLAAWYFTKNNTSQVIGKRVSLGGAPVVQSLESSVVAESWFLRQDKPQTWQVVGSLSRFMQVRIIRLPGGLC